jgi:hypothetical protein
VNSRNWRESSGTPWSGQARYCMWLMCRSSSVCDGERGRDTD